ncbi:MAG: hypothetical protein JO306_03000 [Gemmatimonadetes bacterium]|nr:hypothetical protein [Gemmatimonadota bacterium]
MNASKSLPWRACFALAGLLVMAGGPLHPSGTMPQMLANPQWVLAHSLMLAGFVALLSGLVLYGRATELSLRVRRWHRLALIGTALQAVEMALHTAAVVDGPNLAAGQATPVLSTHLAIAVPIYPFFALVLIGFVVAAARERALGSPWIAPLAVLGLLAHGAAAPLVILGAPGHWNGLFAGLLLAAIWMILSAAWPLRASARSLATAGSPATAGNAAA